MLNNINPKHGFGIISTIQAIRITRCGIKSWKKQHSNFLPLCLQLLWASLPIQQDLAIHWWHLHGHWGVHGHSEYSEVIRGIPGSVSGMTAMKSWSPTPVSVDTMWYDKWYILQGLESSGRIFKKTASSAKDYSSQFLYRSVSQSRQCHRPSFSSIDSPRYLDIQGWWDDP